MKTLTDHQKGTIKKLLEELIDQENPEIIIPAAQPQPGFWFGGGKLAFDQDGMDDIILENYLIDY